MNNQKLLAWIVLGIFLNGCAMTGNWTRRETVTAAAAATCGIIGGNLSGWINHNNGHPLNEGKAIPAGVLGGALLCGGLAYLLTSEPPPPPPPPPPASKVERTIILDDVLFDFEKSNIKPEAGAILDRLVAFMNENKDKSVNLSGHTDNVGTEAYNQRLSERRVNSVKDYIVKKGVDAGRVWGQGFGESKPIADNKTREGRAKNRRVEIKVN